MASSEEDLAEIQQTLLKSVKGSNDFLMAILKTLNLQDPSITDDIKVKEASQFLYQAKVAAKAWDFEGLLEDLIDCLDPPQNEASSFLLKEIVQIQQIQQKFSNSCKGRSDFLSAILDTLKLEDTYAICSEFLCEAKAQIAAKDFQDLLKDLSDCPKRFPNKDFRFLLEEISQIQRLGGTYAHPGTPVAAAQQALQILDNSEMTELDFDNAILATVKLDLSAAERTEEFGPCKILDKAAAEFGAEPSHFSIYLQNLIYKLDRLELQTENAREALATALIMKDECQLALSVEAADCSLGPVPDSGDASAGVVDEAYAVQNPKQMTQVEIKEKPLDKVTQFLAQKGRRSLQDFRIAMLDTFSGSDGACCLTAEIMLDVAWGSYADKVELVPLLDDLIYHLRGPQCAAEPFQALLRDACSKRHKAVEWYGSDDDIAGSSDAIEIPPVPDTTKVHCTAVIFRGQKTRLYLTTQAAAPLIVTLLNGLALSDQGHLIGAHNDTLNMEEMLDLVVEACKTRLNVTGPLPCAESWKLLADCLGFPWEDVENQTKGGDVSVCLQTLRTDVVEDYFKRFTMPRGMVPVKCRLLFDVLQVVVKGPGVATDPRLSSSPKSPKKMGHEASDATAELKGVQLVGEGASGYLPARTESAEIALQQNEEDDIATDQTLVKRRVPEGPSPSNTLAARGSPTAKVPLTCQAVTQPGSEDRGVEDTVQCGKEGEPDSPACHAPPGMPRLDIKTYEGLEQAYCGKETVKTFIYAAEGEGTLHVMAADGDDLFVLNQRERPEGRSHGRGPVPRWFRLALGITYAPEGPKCYTGTDAP